MKKTAKKISKVKGEIDDLKVQIENVKILPYYSVFNRENERERDMENARADLKKAINELHTLYESLQLEVLAELNTLSLMQRENTLKTA